MGYILISGEIIPGRLYYVVDASVVYNGTTYTTGQSFRGIPATKTFIYVGAGTQALYEVLEIIGVGIEYVENSLDALSYADTTQLDGFALELTLNDAEKIIQEITKITGFAIELVDYPFYCFEITETRL